MPVRQHNYSPTSIPRNREDTTDNGAEQKCTDFKVTGAVSLTLSASLPGRVVERETQGNQGSDLQDDEGNVLQGLPYQLQEGFWLFWRYQVFTKYFFPLVQVSLGTCKT